MRIESALAPYPGRAVVYHVAEDGSVGWIYFLTGRSPSSRAREIHDDGDSLVVRPTDLGVPADALRHYRCVRQARGELIVGNGDHVDVIADALVTGATVEEAAQLLEPEPDAPLFTPRIALVPGELAQLVAVRLSGSTTERVVVDAEAVPATATVLGTYSGTRDRPTGSAPIARFAEDRSLDELGQAIWRALDPELRVALVAVRNRDPKPVLALAAQR